MKVITEAALSRKPPIAACRRGRWVRSVAVVCALIGVSMSAGAARGDEPGVDLVAKAEEFVTTVYLRPLNIENATLSATSEHFVPGDLPLCIDVEVSVPNWPRRSSSPTISVCFADGRLWFAAADKNFVDFYSRQRVPVHLREGRIDATLRLIQEWARVEPKRDRNRFAGDRFSTNFGVAKGTRYISEFGVSAVFNACSGLLVVFGTPFPREAR